MGPRFRRREHVRRGVNTFAGERAPQSRIEPYGRHEIGMQQAMPQMRESPPLVLVVDDFEDNRAMYAEFLSYSGYRVEQAANGQEAVELTQGLRPDAVVMDLSLPVMDGWEATRRLKADERTKAIPIIALTGHALSGPSAEAKEAGCDAVLVKPCLPERLVAKLEELLVPLRGPWVH